MISRRRSDLSPQTFGLCLVLAVTSLAVPVRADGPAKEAPFGEALILPATGRGGRIPFPIDLVGAQLASGAWRPPKAGEALVLPAGGTRTWERLAAGADGTYQSRGLVGGHAFFSVASDQDRVMALEASGHTMVWVNGELRTGDPYSHGYVVLPVQLRKGANDFLFSVGRGSLRAKLKLPKADLYFNTADTTLPDLIAGQSYEGWGAVPVTNATTSWQSGLKVVLTFPGAQPALTSLPTLPPLSITKVPFRITGPSASPSETITAALDLRQQIGEQHRSLDHVDLAFRVLKPEQTQKRTFRSRMDGSTQYYALVPARASEATPGLTLTLHGAGVEGLGQAACFTPKSWTHVVAATNRRPFGFDWEDWGRLDALEVLEEAGRTLKTDPRRVWLTGHSMGGHGTWHLGVTYPDKFAAIGPSAGWVSMASYAGLRRPDKADALADLFAHASSPSDTLGLIKNLSAVGVYVLHGDRDDNVPVGQARTMRKALGEFHPDWVYHEQPGAGHWWGNPCVDWPEMFEFFAKRTLPERGQVRRVEFTTAAPSVSAQCHWASIEAQQKAFKLSSIQLTHDPEKRQFSGTTENVAVLALDVGHLKPGLPLEITLDNQKLPDTPWPKDGQKIWLRRIDDQWQIGSKPAADHKSPARAGPFRDVFRNRVQFVIGTKGTAQENAWALQKARFDAETFWYRGNGYIEIITDTAFDWTKDRDRNVVLYGNADTNAAWKPLLGGSPCTVNSGSAVLGGRTAKGDDLGCLFVYPRPGSDVALVGAVSGTGIKGMRLTDRLPYFTSGIAYPDFVLLGHDTLTRGIAGVQAAGYFGNDWTVEHGEFVWR